MNSRRFRPACEWLPSRLSLSGAAVAATYEPPAGPPVPFGYDPAAYQAFLDSSASDYELEANIFYDRAAQFSAGSAAIAAPPDPPPPPTPLRLLIQEVLQTMANSYPTPPAPGVP